VTHRRALSGRAHAVAKTADGNVEVIRALVVAQRSARDMRIKLLNQIRHLGFTAPDELRERFRAVPRTSLAQRAAALRPRPDSDVVTYATKLALQTLGRRVLALEEDTPALDVVLAELVTATAPELVELYGVGVDTAAILLAAAGDNASRIRSEAAWAISVASRLSRPPRARSPGWRLNPGGNRQANHALRRIVFTRMGSEPRTRAYVQRRLDED
jgi:hypothetical protein